MSEFKGTPGPWEFHEDDGEDNQIIVGDNGDVICVIGSYMTSIEEDFANGPLMAASPELFNLVKTANGKNGCHTVAWKEKAKEVLAKALAQ